jgi:hypothetical protein
VDAVEQQKTPVTREPKTSLEPYSAFQERQRKLLWQEHPELSGAKIDKIIDLQERMADVLFDKWLNKRNKKIA